MAIRLAARSATRPRLGWLLALLATWKRATGDLKAAIERWENEGGAQDVPRRRSGDSYGSA
jgi:hypothetical protein